MAQCPPDADRDDPEADRADQQENQAAQPGEDQRRDEGGRRDEQGEACGPTPGTGDRWLAWTAERRFLLLVHQHPQNSRVPRAFHTTGVEEVALSRVDDPYAGDLPLGDGRGFRSAALGLRPPAAPPVTEGSQQSGAPDARVDVRGSVGSGLRATQVITISVKKSCPHTCCGLLSATLMGADMCLP